jgi:hypothetical protein
MSAKQIAEAARYWQEKLQRLDRADLDGYVRSEWIAGIDRFLGQLAGDLS